MLVGYLHMSQLVIVWSGNLPPEAGWLHSRVFGAWGGLALALLLVQLFLPFLLLSWGGLKRNARALRKIALTVAFLCPLHFIWLVQPSFTPHLLSMTWAHLAAFAALGGSWWVAFSTLLRRAQLQEVTP
jgi:hypothetical protein